MSQLVGPTLISWLPSSDPATVGYRLYIGRASRVYTVVGSPIDVGNATSYIYTVNAPGVWYWATRSYDAFGSEGDYSDELSDTFVQIDQPVRAFAS